MTAYELTFQQPYTELHPYYKDLVRCFRKHEFCILDGEALMDPTFNNDHQIEAFRCALREASNEKDRNIIIDESTMPVRHVHGAPIQDVIFQLAPPGHPGSLPEIWDAKDQAVADTLNAPAPVKKFLI